MGKRVDGRGVRHSLIADSAVLASVSYVADAPQAGPGHEESLEIFLQTGRSLCVATRKRPPKSDRSIAWIVGRVCCVLRPLATVY